MGAQSEALAQQFEEMNKRVIATAEAIPEARWQATTADEGWPVGVTIHHIAHNHMSLSRMAQAIASGQTLPEVTEGSRDQRNAAHAERFAAIPRAETLALLRTNGAAAAAILRGIADGQLDQTATMPFVGEVSTRWWIEQVIGHAGSHLHSILAATA